MFGDIPDFKGARKINTLPCYPLKYHAEEATLRTQLIERGKKFVALQGVNYRAHEGMAFFKKKKQIMKVSINGRIMVDPAIHRRINPNYEVSTGKCCAIFSKKVKVSRLTLITYCSISGLHLDSG